MSIESLNAFSMDFFSLKGKTAIVTGGNSGLGQAFAMRWPKLVQISLFQASLKITAKQRE